MTVSKPKVLLIANTTFFPPYLDELPAMQADGSTPSTWAFDIDADIVYLDQRLHTNPSRLRHICYRALPMWVVQVLEAYRVGRDYDAIFCWSVADVALVLALLTKVSRRRLRLVALLTRVSEPKKARLLRLVHSEFARIILPPVTQREYAVTQIGVPPEKLVGLPWTVDTSFWSSRADGPGTIVSAAGGEMRDYATLVEAMSGLDMPCHIAGVLDTARRDWWNADEQDRLGEEAAPPNVTFGTMSPVDLRDLYDRSRIVVVPLRSTDSDNGITAMNEAWSMGKPVIVSQVEGQRDAFVDGQEGLWVPVGDADALRRAILDLWHDPIRAAAIGAAGRRLVTGHRQPQVFSRAVSGLLADVAAVRRPSRRRRILGRALTW